MLSSTERKILIPVAVFGLGLLQVSWIAVDESPTPLRLVGATGAAALVGNSPNTSKVPEAGFPAAGAPPWATRTRPLVVIALVNFTEAESWSRSPVWLLLYNSVKLPDGVKGDGRAYACRLAGPCAP